MPRLTMLAVLVALALPAGCGSVRRGDCLPITAVVHVVDGQGSGDRVLLRLRHVQDHADGIYEFVLPRAWERLGTLAPVDGFAPLASMPPVELTPRPDLVVPDGEAFSPALLPEHERGDGPLLFQRRGSGPPRPLDDPPTDDDRITAQRTLDRVLSPDRGLALDDALVAKRRAYVVAADVDEATGARTWWIAGLAHDPPRWVRLAEWQLEPIPQDDPYWDSIDCDPPPAWATALRDTGVLLIWLGWFALLAGA